jgi:radical SAM superfamily enzyme YgiQ (UPF0313 family)
VKILLINPPEKQTVQANLPSAVENLRGATPPIGLMYVAGAARKISDADVSLLDAHALRLSYNELEQRIALAHPDLVGITTTTFTMPDVLETVRRVRGAAPGARLIAGGLQPFLYPEETINLDAFDYALQGEAEISFPRFLKALEDGKGMENVPGILFKQNGEIVSNPPPPLNMDLDALPFPAHDLLPIERYSSLVTLKHPVGIIISSRGCPFRCSFCSHSPTGKEFRIRSAENVVKEMIWCRSLGFSYLLFYDEIMTLKKERVFELRDRIRAEGVRVPWMARLRAGLVDKEMLIALKDAGCDLVTMGIEAGSPKVLSRLNRPTDTSEVIETFKDASKIGLKTLAYFMIGNPDETREDLEMSLTVAQRAAPDMIHASVFMPYPATDLYAEGLQSGFFDRDYWREFATDPSADFHPRLWIATGREAEIMKSLLWFYRRFHLRPSYIWKRLSRLTGWAEFRNNVRGLLTLLSQKRWKFGG